MDKEAKIIEEQRMAIEKKILGKYLSTSTGECQRFWQHMKVLAEHKKWHKYRLVIAIILMSLIWFAPKLGLALIVIFMLADQV